MQITSIYYGQWDYTFLHQIIKAFLKISPKSLHTNIHYYPGMPHPPHWLWHTEKIH